MDLSKKSIDYNDVAKVLHPIGMACSSLIIVTLIVFTLLRRDLVNRVSLRLVGMISFADLMLHLQDYLVVSHREEGAYCKFISAFIMFGTYLYCFTNLAVAFTLYSAFIRLKPLKTLQEIILWLVVIVLSFTAPVILWAAGKLGKSKRLGLCVSIDDTTGFYFLRITKLIALIVTILCCTALGIQLQLKMKTLVKQYIQLKNEEDDDGKVDSHQEIYESHLQKHIQRSLLYIMNPLITQTGCLMFVITDLASYHALWARGWFTIGFSLSGILTFICFVLDISVQTAISTVFFKKSNIGEEHEDYELDDVNPQQSQKFQNKFLKLIKQI